MTKTRPFLKWAGGKYSCLDIILSALPAANRLIEPFTGSGAIFVNASYSHYILGEGNKDLVHLYQLLQRDGESFITYCKRLFTPANNCAEQYYQLREQFNRSTYSRKRAALFLYLNRHGYNGLCRYNQKGIYNVPFGLYANPYFPHKEMLCFYKKSQQATFLHSDFRNTFSHAKPGDVIYCDPPYAPIVQYSNFSSYTDTTFGEPEQIALAELALEYVNRGMTIIISNHDTEFTRHQYRDSEIKSFPVKRYINCKAENRVAAQELLAIFRPNQ